VSPGLKALHVKVTIPLKPLVGVTVTVNCEVLPTVTTPLPLGGFTVMEKSGAALAITIVSGAD
jgi:hypothetical protein